MAAPKKRREAERELKAKGFTQQPGRGKGSHQVWKDQNGNSVTVPTHGDEIAAGTWRSIERQTNQAPRQTPSDAQNAQRLANDGVAKAGKKGRGSGQQGQQGQPSGQQQQKPAKRRLFGGRDGR